MAIRYPTATRNASAAAVATLADAGAGPATIEVRSGTQPASANDADAGTLLATFTLGDPSFGAPAIGVITLASVPRTTTGAAAGTAGHFRMKDSTGATVLDGSVTATGGGGDMTLNTVTVSVGVDLGLTSGTITIPAG